MQTSNDFRADFPLLEETVNGKPLVYLDSASSAQKPRVVIDAMVTAYTREYSNVHRGQHYLSYQATEKYEGVRDIVVRFLNAASEQEIVFTSGATHSINLVSYAWAAPRLNAGDEIILSVMEHHANIVPWHFLRERQGVVLKWVECDANGELDPQAVLDAIGPRTKLIAITHMSNVLGTITDVKSICRGAREKGVPVLIDGSQGSVHAPVDVQDIGCDFYAVTGHKLYGPSGSGALYARLERLEEMRPFFGGGDMIRDVTRETVVYASPPLRFEAGTPAIVPQYGFGKALNYLMAIGMDRIAENESRIRDYALESLKKIEGLRIFGDCAAKGPLFSFAVTDGPNPHAIASRLDARGIAVRAGSFCSRPLLQHLGVTALCRASFGLYNSFADVDALCSALTACVKEP